jgi:hypothetical protein
MTNFNIVFLCIDNAGYQFIDGCNESEWFKRSKIELKMFDFDSDKEGIDYQKELRKARFQYNMEDNKICFKQVFTSNWLRKANEHLQASIDHKKIWFASRATAHGTQFDRISTSKVPLKETGHDTILDLIEFQDSWVYQTKKQCTLIEVKSTAKGTQSFDLPQHLARSTATTRARKDNYTTLMLANWALKCYNDMMSEKEEIGATFSPRLV